MSEVRIEGDEVLVLLSRGERIAALRGHLRVPRSAVRSAEVVEDGLRAVHGLRAPGLSLPGRVKVGTWRARGDRQLVAVRRGEPAVRLTLQGQRYDTVLVSTPHAAEVAGRLRS